MSVRTPTILNLPALVSSILLCLFSSPAQSEVSETHHGSWTVRCETTAPEQAPSCIMFQNLVLKTGGQTVLQFAVGMTPDNGQATVLLSLPLGISLPPGVMIQIDDGKIAQFPVERCEPDGCRAGMKLRETTVNQLRDGSNLEITFFDGERHPIRMPLSLTGFGAAFAALQEVLGNAQSR